MMKTSRATHPSVVAVLMMLGVSACTPAGDGVSPPSDNIYFPVGLTVDADDRFLYVVNSDFDLQFNQGTVQSLDLERVAELTPQVCSSDDDCEGDRVCDDSADDDAIDNGGVPSFFCVQVNTGTQATPCGVVGEPSPAERALAPGRCGPVSLDRPPDGKSSLIVESVEISAFATDGLLLSRPPDAPEGPQRLFVPVRGDTSLHWLDVEDGKIDCGQGGGSRCSDTHKTGDNAEADNTRGVSLPPEPYGIDASEDGRVLVMTHQTQGAASAVVNDWVTPPRLEWVQTGLPTRVIGVAAVPKPAVLESSEAPQQSGFLVTFRNSATVHLLRFFDDGAFSVGSTPSRPFLVDVGSSPITVNSIGTDSRGIAIDGTLRRDAEAACGQDDDECLAAAAEVPLEVYVANRTPPSLLVGVTESVDNSTSTRDLPDFYDNLPLTAGPSRVQRGFIIDENGDLQRRIFVLCFDSSLIFVYDPARHRIETEIYTGRGPYSMAFDATRGVAYVGHFTDSYLGVVSLDQRFPATYGTIIASLGTPTPPRASK